MALKKLLRNLGRPVTLLVIPHGPMPLFRAQFSLAFIFFIGLLWAGFMAWAGFLAGHRVDYWVTKMDNRFLRDKVRFLASEIGQSRDLLAEAQTTDREMRSLLGMGSRRAIVEEAALGGPGADDRLDVAALVRAPKDVPRAAVRRRLIALRRETKRRIASFQEIGWYIDQQRSLYRATPNIWPTEGRLTSAFGYRISPFGGGEERFGEFHPGVDIANRDVTPILATADGVVRHAGWSGGYGQMVMIDHGHGFTTLFGHTSKIVVRTGRRVARGEVIAYMGTTGRSTGNHLHYEVWRAGKPVNPMRYMGPRPAKGSLVALGAR